MDLYITLIPNASRAQDVLARIVHYSPLVVQDHLFVRCPICKLIQHKSVGSGK